MLLTHVLETAHGVLLPLHCVPLLSHAVSFAQLFPTCAECYLASLVIRLSLFGGSGREWTIQLVYPTAQVRTCSPWPRITFWCVILFCIQCPVCTMDSPATYLPDYNTGIVVSQLRLVCLIFASTTGGVSYHDWIVHAAAPQRCLS